MKYKELLKEIDRHTWWSEECPATIQTIIYMFKCYILQSKVFHPKLVSLAIIGVKGDFIYERSPEDEKYTVYKYVFEKMKKDKNFLYKIIKILPKKIDLFFKEFSYFNKNKNKMDNKELCNSYTRFMNKYLDYLPYQAGIECIDILTTYYLEDMVRKELSISSDKITDIVFALSCPKILSFMEKERVDFLDICLSNYDDIKKNKLTDNLKKQLDKHSRKYFYVLNNFKTIKYLDRDYFLNKAKEEVKDKIKLQNELNNLKKKVNNLKKKEKEICKKYKFSDELKLHLKITKIMGESIDKRKENMLKATYYIEEYCKEIAKRFNIKLSKIMDYTFEETQKLLLKGKKADEELLKKRKKCSVYLIERKKLHDVKITWFYGNQAENILKRISSQTKTKEIKGQVASSPVKKIKGIVQVILDTSKKEFRKGNILVTTMTRPDFVPLMRKAKAIITDEGGITCHAAIVSREIGIPCIIGTKVATKILKDGDLIEMDADKGVVKILKRK